MNMVSKHSRSLQICIGAIGLMALTACSSITGETQQSISVETRHINTTVNGATCELTNDKGKWFTNTPGSVMIAKSNQDLIVSCQKESHEPGIAKVTSQTGAGMAGNVGLALLVPIVGILGAIIDHSSGAVYKYPPLVQIIMGQTIAIDGSLPTGQPAAGAKSSIAGVQPSVPATLTTITITESGVSETVTPLSSDSTKKINANSAPAEIKPTQGGLDAAKNRCIELGLKPQTDSFGECIMRFTK
jgi:hypothetical protein